MSPASRSFARPWASTARARAATLALCAAVAGCAGVPPEPPALRDALFDDAHVAPPREPIDPRGVFAITPAMREYLDRELLPEARRLGERQALATALYARGGLRLDYEATTTRDAGQAFEARAGNCLSLAIMTAAFARALGLEVTFQAVETDADDSWSRAGGLYVLSGHVNLVLSHPLVDRMHDAGPLRTFTIDFLPPDESTHPVAQTLDEKTVLAMYMNNRAAEAMLQGGLDDAYWRARAAIGLDPAFAGAYNTLGVVYLRRADAAHAEAALRYGLRRAPGNAPLLANEVLALHALHRDAEAREMQARLETVETWPPFLFFERGQAAYRAGRLDEARGWFLKEIARSPDYHEFHFWLAITDYRLGDIDGARREMARAAGDAVRRTDRDLYAAKLDRLNALPSGRAQ